MEMTGRSWKGNDRALRSFHAKGTRPKVEASLICSKTERKQGLESDGQGEGSTKLVRKARQGHVTEASQGRVSSLDFMLSVTRRHQWFQLLCGNGQE